MINETNTISIVNNSGLDMDIIHEPECFEFKLPVNEEVTIETIPCKESLQLKIGIDEGKIFISIIPDRSLYAVYHQGVNVFKEFLE